MRKRDPARLTSMGGSRFTSGDCSEYARLVGARDGLAGAWGGSQHRDPGGGAVELKNTWSCVDVCGPSCSLTS